MANCLSYLSLLILVASVKAMTEHRPGLWGGWTSCSPYCGPSSSRFRLRNCNNAPNCIPYQSEECDVDPCPVWEDWTPWTECSTSCGTGEQRRTRRCVNGPGCEGESENMRSCWHNCNECIDIWKSCADIVGEWCDVRYVADNCEKSCQFCEAECSCMDALGERSLWSAWTSCSASCGGGVMRRSRSCDNVPDHCGLRSEEEIRCNTGACIEVGICTKECGGGTTKVEICDEKDPSQCWNEYRDCNTNPCEAVTCQSDQVHRYRTNASCCAPSTNPFQCGIYRIESNIVGGEEATPSDWPWMALVILGREDVGETVYCGGSVIADRWVVTAAHCVMQFRHSPDTVRIAVGARTLDNLETVVKSKRVVVYSKEFQFPHHDIALIELEEPLDLLSDENLKGKVSPICLPMGEETPNDQQCYATGWGATNPANPEMSRQLNQVKMRHFDLKVCQQLHETGGGAGLIDEFKTCAGRIRGGVDTCVGDSGGPLVCQRCSTCSWYLVGITSFGSSNCGEPGYPGVYTKLSAYQDWIFSVIGKRTESESFIGTCTK